MESKASSRKIWIISGACCGTNPNMQERAMENMLVQALFDLGMFIQIERIFLSEILIGSGNLDQKQRSQILALYESQGAKFTPALLIGDEVKFASKRPTLGQVKDILQRME